MTKKEMEERVAKLEKEVDELKKRPAEHHHHYPVIIPQPFPVYPQPVWPHPYKYFPNGWWQNSQYGTTVGSGGLGQQFSQMCLSKN